MGEASKDRAEERVARTTSGDETSNTSAKGDSEDSCSDDDEDDG